jgi:8-oxo-dGTP pyrophosphatase MutT (NUDIX family)
MQSWLDITVAAIVERDGRFLMVEERVGTDLVFNQPAGHLERGESLLEAAIRETREETGYAFTPEYLVGIYTWLREADEQSFMRVCLAGRADPPSLPVELDVGIVAAHWLTRDELLAPGRQLRSPLVLRCIDDFLAAARHSLDCLTNVIAEPARTSRRA